MFKKFSWQKIKLPIIIIAILFLSFLSLTVKTASAPPIIITEIAAFEKTDFEWLEIYNRGQLPIDLTDWTFWEGITASSPQGANHKLTVSQGGFTLVPQAYAVIAQNAEKFKTAHQFGGIIFDSSWSSLNESGEQIGLKDENKNIIEAFIYLPAGNASLERINLALDDYSAKNWQERASGDSAGRTNDDYSQDQQNQSAAQPDPSVVNDNVKPPADESLIAETADDVETSNDAPALDKSDSVATTQPAEPLLESICEIRAEAGPNITAGLGQEIIFDGSSSAVLTTKPDDEIFYFWNFDDGQQAEGVKVAHAYQTEGDYHPYLIVAACGQDDKSKIRVTVSSADQTSSVDLSNSQPTDLTINETSQLSTDILEQNQALLQSNNNVLTITKVKQLPLGAKAILEGIVIIEPNIFSKNYFYIIDETGAGLQIYSYYADFPQLKVGHLIEASGELSQIYQEKRLKIKNKDDLKFLSVQDPPYPPIKKIADLSLKSAGDFIQTQGEIVEMKGDEIFIQDNTGELKIVLKENAGLDKSIFTLNEQIKAAGIISLTQSGLRLLPRFSGDLQKADSPSANYSQVLGQTVSQSDAGEAINFTAAGNKELIIPANKARSVQILKYLLSLTAVIGVIIIGLIIKRARSSVG